MLLPVLFLVCIGLLKANNRDELGDFGTENGVILSTQIPTEYPLNDVFDHVDRCVNVLIVMSKCQYGT